MSQIYIYCLICLSDPLSLCSVFKTWIIANQSAIKLPDGVPRRNNSQLCNTIEWSASLDPTFQSIRERDPDIR